MPVGFGLNDRHELPAGALQEVVDVLLDRPEIDIDPGGIVVFRIQE